MSSEVENLLRTSLVDEEVGRVFERMGIEIEVPASPEVVKRGRPELRGPSSEDLVREMRGRRVAEGIPR